MSIIKLSAGMAGGRAGRRVWVWLAILGACAGLDAAAGTVSIVNIPSTGSDASSGLSSIKTYTHALDFSDTTGTQVINGVTFTKVNAASGTGYTCTGPVAFSTNNGSGCPITYTDGNMSNMLTDLAFYNTSSTTDAAVVTLTGLTPGKQYSTRVYYRRWDINARPATFTFNGDGTNTSVVVDSDADAAAHYLKYDFIASGSTVTISAVAQIPGSVWLFFGISNEEAFDIPPATLSIANIAAVNSDLSSGLSPAKTYTHALDFGDTTGTLTINGVAFTKVNAASGTGYTCTGPVAFSTNNGSGRPFPYTDGNMSNMLMGFCFYNTPSTTQPAVVTLTGLTPGKRYSTRLYYRKWDNDTRTSTFTFNGDGSNLSIVADEDADAGAHYLEYKFTATGSNVSISAVAQTANYVWLFFGISNEEAFDVPTTTLSIVDIPAVNSDAASGLKDYKHYTHALDFGDTTGSLVINGVTFTKVNTASGTGYDYSNTGGGTFYTHAGNGNTHADGNMSNMLNSIMYYNYAPSWLALSGLTPGKKYSTRLYYRPWTDNSTRNGTLTFDVGYTNTSVDVNADAGAGAHYLAYDFTALNASILIKMQYVNGIPWTLFGLTTEERVPPRGTIVRVR